MIIINKKKFQKGKKHIGVDWNPGLPDPDPRCENLIDHIVLQLVHIIAYAKWHASLVLSIIKILEYIHDL